MSKVAQAWGYSLVVHGFTIAGMLWLVSEIRPVSPSEPFRWEVALVEPSVSEPVEDKPSPPMLESAPTRPQPPAPVVQARRQEIMDVRPIETKPVVESRPVQQAVQTQMIHNVERAKPVMHEAQTAPVQQPAEKADPQQPVAKDVRQTAEVATQTESMATERAVVTRQEASATSSDAIEREMAAIQRTPIQEAKARPEAVTPTPRAEPSPPSAPVRNPAPAQPPAVHSSVAHATAATRPDYGWLGDALRRRVNELYKYPPKARLDHQEGLVTVRVVVKEDGRLDDIRIVKSSGHDILDEAALDTVRQASPIEMKYPLGISQKQIDLPMRYHLE